MSGSVRFVARRMRACLGAAAVLGVALTGCGRSGAADAVDGSAEQFRRVLGAGDFARACDLLTPATRSEIAERSSTSCAAALPTHDLPHSPGSGGVEVFGRSAQVKFSDDVVFLALVQGRWQVAAAGCQADVAGRYDCDVKGG